MTGAQVLDMSDAGFNVLDMSKMIQIRNVPEEMHRALKVRAAEQGLSLSDYIKQELRWVTGKSTMAEIFDRAEARGPSGLTREMIVDLIREGRGD
jgi:plasmid stability protein